MLDMDKISHICFYDPMMCHAFVPRSYFNCQGHSTYISKIHVKAINIAVVNGIFLCYMKMCIVQTDINDARTKEIWDPSIFSPSKKLHEFPLDNIMKNV